MLVMAKNPLHVSVHAINIGVFVAMTFALLQQLQARQRAFWVEPGATVSNPTRTDMQSR